MSSSNTGIVPPYILNAVASSDQVTESVKEDAARTLARAALVLRFVLQWDFYLDPDNESNLSVHAFVSTLYSSQVHIIPLETAKGRRGFSLTFTGSKLSTVPVGDVVESCDLNLHFFIETKNNYNEAVPNTAGTIVVPLHEIVHALVNQPSEPRLEKSVDLFMIRNPDQSTKGTIEFTSALVGTPKQKVPCLSLRGVAVTSKDYDRAAVQRSIRRNVKIQQILNRYIELTESIHAGVRPTLEQVALINTDVWNSAAGMKPPIAYMLDVVDPGLQEPYFANCLDIVLKRQRVTKEELLRWNISGPNANPQHIINMENICGQVLCAYVIHCIYRQDFVYVYDRKLQRYFKKPTENFGDVTVDLGSGDCEDFSKIIVRSYRALRRLSGQVSSKELQHVINFLNLFYPFLALLGVSSAQINAAPRDIVKMGGHENTICLPKLKFLRIAGPTTLKIRKWVEEKMQNTPNDPEVLAWKESLACTSVVCEGTGILRPTRHPEDTKRLRLYLEDLMTSDTFYALRREYFFDGDEGFYKTSEKILLPIELFDQPLAMPTFLVMRQNVSSANAARMPLAQALSKSASFAGLTDAASSGNATVGEETVRFLMEPLLTRAEWVAIYEMMRNIHPPVPQLPPSNPPTSMRRNCDDLVSRFIGPILEIPKPFVHDDSALHMTYYMRASKVDIATCRDVAHFLQVDIPQQVVRSYDVYSEWVTDRIGGYRIELTIDKVEFQKRDGESH